MIKIEDFVTIDENGKLVYDTAAFNAAVDKERTQASETASKNTAKKVRSEVEAELREKLENEAKLTAEEKFQAQLEAFRKEKREFDADRIRAIYKDADLTDSEIDIMLSTLGDDSKKNLETAQKFADARKEYNAAQRKKLEQEFTLNSKHPQDNNGGSNQEKSIGTLQAERFNKNPDANKEISF